METYITICKGKWEFAVCLRELKQALYQSREVGWEGNGREVQKGGDICIPLADSWLVTENNKIP